MQVVDETAKMLNEFEQMDRNKQHELEQKASESRAAAELAEKLKQFESEEAKIRQRLDSGYTDQMPLNATPTKPPPAKKPVVVEPDEAERRLQTYQMLYKEHLVASTAAFQECGMKPTDFISQIADGLMGELMNGAAESILHAIDGYADHLLSTELPSEAGPAHPLLTVDTGNCQVQPQPYRQVAAGNWHGGNAEEAEEATLLAEEAEEATLLAEARAAEEGVEAVLRAMAIAEEREEREAAEEEAERAREHAAAMKAMQEEEEREAAAKAVETDSPQSEVKGMNAVHQVEWTPEASPTEASPTSPTEASPAEVEAAPAAEVTSDQWTSDASLLILQTKLARGKTLLSCTH